MLCRIRTGNVHSLRHLSTFVSKHYVADPTEISNLITVALKSEYRRNGNGEFEIKECTDIICSRPNKSKPDNTWKFLIREDGSYYCHRCSKGGSWFDLKKRVFQIEKFVDNSPTEVSDDNPSVDDIPSVLPDQDEAFRHTSLLFPLSNHPPSEDRKKALAYLTEVRKLLPAVLMRYGVGIANQKFLGDSEIWEETLCVTFPWIVVKESQSTIIRVKFRAVASKGKQRILPKGGKWGFFGWHTIKPQHTSIIITEGEYDAMAVAQALSALPGDHSLRDIPAISLPNGCNSFPPELVRWLERFKKIYLWMDNDKPGQEAVEKFSVKLGRHRCWIVRPDSTLEDAPKDANDALRKENGANLIVSLLQLAQQPRHDRIESFSDLKHEVIQSIRDGFIRGENKREGTQTPSLDGLSAIVKGFRRGELVLLTGPTGGGKTTILSQISLDFAMQGVPTLWGSFEIKNTRLISKMLHQFGTSGGLLENLNHSQFMNVVDDFEGLPIKFLNFHGSSDLDQIMEAIDFSVYRDDSQHIIIDNLQFMLPRKRGLDKFDQQDAVIEALRKFATEKNVNIVLVIHPRKDDESTRLNMSSIFGTAKATQEADTVLIMQRKQENGVTILDVKKNRFDGQLGSIHMKFSPPRCSFYEVDPRTIPSNSSTLRTQK